MNRNPWPAGARDSDKKTAEKKAIVLINCQTVILEPDAIAGPKVSRS